MLKSVLISSVALTAIAGAAHAADLPSRAAAPVPYVAPAFTWTGFYVGLNGGYGFGPDHKSHIDEYNGAPLFFSGEFGKRSQDGIFGGAQAGYNAQFGNFVLGLEADLQASDISGKSMSTIAYLGGGTSITGGISSRVDWFGTIRPRLGYSFDRVLVYVTGGLAFGGVRARHATLDSFGFNSLARKDQVQAGYALGAGVEYAVSGNWTAKLEYQYVDLGDTKLAATEFLRGAPAPFETRSKVRSDFHTIRLGVNYKF